MSQNKSLQSKMPLAMGLAFVAFTTQFGGGFASGAQIYQYFINYGIWCLIFPAVTQGLYALFFWYGMRYAYKHKTYDYRSFSDSLYGKTKPVMSNLYEICYLIMIGTASAAAFATGGSTLQTLFGIPYWLCTMIIAVFIFVIVCFGQVCSSMSVGYALARLRFPGKKVWFYLIVGSMMIPGMVTVIPVFRLWAACGFYGTWWPMIIPAFLGAPFQTFLAKQFMSGLPKSYDEAARMDGASRLQVLLKVIGPMCKPLIAVIAIQSFQGAWNDYLTPLLYVISKPEKWTLSLAVGRMTSSTYGTQWNLFMAADVVYMLPILILFFFCQKYFMEGLGSLNSSGIKA